MCLFYMSCGGFRAVFNSVPIKLLEEIVRVLSLFPYKIHVKLVGIKFTSGINKFVCLFSEKQICT